MKKVLLLGSNHHNLLGVIRSLGRAGINPFVIMETLEKKPYVGYSKYIAKKWLVQREDEILPIMLDSFKNEDNKVVVIACADNLASLLDVHKDILSPYFVLPGTEEQNLLSKLMNKEVMSKLAEQIGFNVPPSIVVDSDKIEQVDVKLPCITKPLYSKDGSKTDIWKCATKEEWNLFCKAEITSKQVQIQEFIKKKFEFQFIGCSLDGGNVIVIPGVSFVIRPSETSNTGFLKYMPISKSYEKSLLLSVKFIRAIKYSGLFSIEFLRDMDDKDYFMEMNFRNDGNSICSTGAGFNLPLIWYQHKKIEEMIGVNKCKSTIKGLYTFLFKPIYVMPEIQDFYIVAVKREITFWNWLKDVKRTDVFMEFSKSDILPFLRLLLYYISRIIHK